MPRGLNEGTIRPIMIEVKSKGIWPENIKPEVISYELDQNMINYIHELINYTKHFKKEDIQGPII